MEFINKSGLEFVDISSEHYREYIWRDGGVVRIDWPLWLNCSERGHRLFSADGVSHYVPFGWAELRWKVKDGAPNFVK